MAGKPPICLLFFLFLVSGVIVSGCSDRSLPAETAVPASHPEAKYGEGDIVATPSSTDAESLYLILKYDPATDQYTRAVIERYTDGSWGYRTSGWTEKIPRAVLERTYTIRAGHVVVSLVPVITPTPITEITQKPSGGAPAVSQVSPASAARDTIVRVTVSGSHFQDGATVRLFRAGSAPITATGVSVTAFDLSCLFNLNGKGEGVYSLLVINPDGQYGSLADAFTVSGTAPVIGGIYPASGALNTTVSLTVSGQNFRNEVKVSFTRNATELVCDRPLSTGSTRISCTLDLAATRGASAGEWTVAVLNIRDGQKGMWVKKFTVINTTKPEK